MLVSGAGSAIFGGMNHSFPDCIREHKLSFVDGTSASLYVDPTETLGHAMARAGYALETVACVEVDGPVSYEPDFRSATR